ncbi:hypothetical protein IT072_19830 [Leifsonia sp. ZF2019]|uniref:hypothetical protein n=1 Tax=Leifsonia sp. ZF2019 TaxID=2781978 RepID=UPI001CBFB7E2|nr:hypothetical protein [Leifsonia sp. ZF2019]UAJ79408.1 hypothetical protein IT072_19830 [Leifsonia sp. ZF2019]
MNESQLIRARKKALHERIWEAFRAEDFVLDVDPVLGALVVREPRHGSKHELTVEFDENRAVADWDDLLSHHVNPLDRSAWAEVEVVVAEICDRLWDAGMVASASADRLVYEGGYFNGIPNGERRGRTAPPGAEGSLRWELEDE